MTDRALTLPADCATRLDNLARRLGLPLDEALCRIAARMDLMDYLAAQLSSAPSIPCSSAPLRLRPTQVLSEEIATIWVNGALIETALGHPDERFIAVVKALRYRWSSDRRRWQRQISKFAEPVADRAVELGIHILNAGFPVEVHSADLHQRIAAGDYRPEVKTWLSARTKGRFTDWFCIQWDRDGYDYYRLAAHITGSRCYPGAALVPATAYDEALDFAECNGFAISDGALDLAARARAERAAMLLADPALAAPLPVIAADPLPAGAVTQDILDELADEPL